MNFISYEDLRRDLIQWAPKLPRVCAVVGIPGSGLLVASMLGLHLNVPVFSVYDLLKPECPAKEQLSLRRGDRVLDGPYLVVDDSHNTGATIDHWKTRLTAEGYMPSSHVLYAAVYVTNPLTENGLDLCFKQLAKPRFFEWNVFHSRAAAEGLFDMDGVLTDQTALYTCPEEDWNSGDRDKLAFWNDYLENAPPLYIPSVKILGVVTSRLSRYREQTQAWLRKYGVDSPSLIMSPHATATARRRAKDSGKIKGAIYRKNKDAKLFFESEKEQALDIVQVSGKPVLWVGGMKMFLPGS